MTELTEAEKATHERDLRQLALVDRIIGLEAEVAHLSAANSSQAMMDQLKEVHSSTTWKVGRLVLAPVFAIQSLISPNSRKGK